MPHPIEVIDEKIKAVIREIFDNPALRYMSLELKLYLMDNPRQIPNHVASIVHHLEAVSENNITLEKQLQSLRQSLDKLKKCLNAP